MFAYRMVRFGRVEILNKRTGKIRTYAEVDVRARLRLSGGIYTKASLAEVFEHADPVVVERDFMEPVVAPVTPLYSQGKIGPTCPLPGRISGSEGRRYSGIAEHHCVKDLDLDWVGDPTIEDVESILRMMPPPGYYNSRPMDRC